jgi:hypothetical protein
VTNLIILFCLGVAAYIIVGCETEASKPPVVQYKVKEQNLIVYSDNTISKVSPEVYKATKVKSLKAK